MSARPLIIIGIALEAFIITLYGIFVRFDQYSRMENQTDLTRFDALQIFLLKYPLFQDIHVMIFIGFGFLKTFLKHHSWSGVSLSFIAAGLTIQLYILFEGFWHALFQNDWSDPIIINAELLIRADYAAAAVLISFGGIIGRVNTPQLLLIATIETFIYALQEMIVLQTIKAVDAGGSITIHTFGAYFGLMLSLTLTKNATIGDPYKDSSYNSNLFAMLGTLFLWIHWPSFNSAMVSDSAGMHRAVTNTVLSLTGSCISTFIFSSLYNQGQLHMEDILNATLAGGVIIGSSCDLIVYPFISILLGSFAGILSTVGYRRLSEYLEYKIGLFDTAGINNLHGIPGLFGGILSAIIIATLGNSGMGIKPSDYGFDDYYMQGGLQIAATLISLGYGLVGGTLTGLVIKFLPLGQTQSCYQDKPYWIKCDPDPYEHLKIKAVVPLRKKEKKSMADAGESIEIQHK